jgi:hypothetical protein
MGYEVDVRGIRVRFTAKARYRAFSTVFRPALEPTQTLIQLVLAKRPGRETDHSHPYSTEVKNVCSYDFTPPFNFISWSLIN